MVNRVFLIFIILGTYKSYATQSACNLCATESLSCNRQVRHFNLSDDDCRMVYYERNGKACSSLAFEGQSHSTDLGNVILQSYLYIDGVTRQTGFNVSFMDIRWTNITMRFTQNGDPEKNSCREFHVSKKFLAFRSISLFYDCLWSHYEYEEKIYNFEYLATNSLASSYHKYVFIVPRGDRINPRETELSKWEVFMYIDKSLSPIIVMKGQTLPKHYNATKYLVKVCSGTIHDSVCKVESNITASEDEYEITYEWHIGILPGNYFFTVQPLSADCGESGCLISKSPYITNTTFNPIYVSSGLVAVVLLSLVCIYLKLKRSLHGSKDPGSRTLLLIYRSTHSSHIKVVVELAKYLRKHCNINAMVDELDVNKSESQSPFHWYNDAVADADFIAIVSSPTCCNSISGIYPKADEAALCLLRGNAFKRDKFSKAYNLMVFMLPYGSKNHLPVEAKNIGLEFKIPNHINEASYYVHNFREMYFFEKFYHSLKTRSNFIWNLIKDRKSLNKKCAWPELQAAIQEARAEVKRCVVNRDRMDLKDPKYQNIFQDIRKENLKPEDPVEMSPSEGLPLDDTMAYPELDGLDLLGSKIEVVIEKSVSDSLLDDLLL